MTDSEKKDPIHYQLVRVMKKFFYPKNTIDGFLTDKQTIHINKNQIDDFPSSVTPSSHNHTKNQITDFSHTHTKNQITDFPTSMTPSAHTHTKSDITDFSHNHTKNQITDFPTSMTPSAHTHTKSEITDFSHTHTKNQITDFPSTMPPSSHNHDDKYYTETEIDNKLSGKANSSHNQNASTIISQEAYQYIGTSILDSQETINQKINSKFMALDEVFFGTPVSYRQFDQSNISSSILKGNSMFIFIDVGDLVFVEYSIKGASNSATNELLVTNYLDSKYRPFYSSKYFDLSPHREECTPIRVEITDKGHIGVTPLQPKQIASYGSFFYFKHIDAYGR